MAETKDKVVTVESLSALHEYNVETYETKENASQSLTNVENALESLESEINGKLDTKFDKPTNNIVPIANGGTGSSDGVTGLKNLFAAGITVLSSYQYGDELPAAGTVGRIFFKRLTDVQN